MDLLYHLICFDRTPVEHGDTLQTAHFSVKIEIYNIIFIFKDDYKKVSCSLRKLMSASFYVISTKAPE